MPGIVLNTTYKIRPKKSKYKYKYSDCSVVFIIKNPDMEIKFDMGCIQIFRDMLLIRLESTENDYELSSYYKSAILYDYNTENRTVTFIIKARLENLYDKYKLKIEQGFLHLILNKRSFKRLNKRISSIASILTK
tara:strand:+ start:308 stop:712 length:405 start_codon:yes stop_codon:yes gene_type:complete